MGMPGTPVQLTEVELSKIVDYLSVELNDALAAHRVKEEKLDKWQKAYDGTPSQLRKDFPWPGACNVVIPLIGIAVDSIVARIVNTLFAPEPFWGARALRKEVEPAIKPIENYLEWSRKNEFNAYQEVRKWIPEIVKFGWGYLKVGWRVSTQRSMRVDEYGNAVPMNMVIRAPDFHHVPLRDMITQPGIEDELNQAEWLAQRCRATDGQLRWREYDGIYEGIDEIVKYKEDFTERELAKFDREAQGAPQQKLNTFYEVWANIPTFGNSKLPDNILVTYHMPSRKVMRVIYNPCACGYRPFPKAKFLEREGELEGNGIASRLADMQDEITTIHRQQVDNATLANTRFFLGRRGVVRPDTKIWPGRFLMVPNPKEDVIAVAMGETYASMARLSTEILAFSERASGVSDPFLGRESSVVGTRATATGTLAILQEGNRRFDLNVRDIRDALGTAGRIVLDLNQQFRPRGASYSVIGEDGQLVEAVLDLPQQHLASLMALELSASTATINRSVEQQGLISLMGLLSQYYQQSLQTGFLVMNPDTPPALREYMAQMLSGAQSVMRRLIQTFDVKDIDAVLPTMMMEANGNAALQGGTPAPGGGGAQFGGMAPVASPFGAPVGAGGNGGMAAE